MNKPSAIHAIGHRHRLRALGGAFKHFYERIREASIRMQTNQPSLAKVLVAGGSGVGKTSLVNRLVFSDFRDVLPTIGVNFAQKVCIGNAGSELDIGSTACHVCCYGNNSGEARMRHYL